jgi:hypothetical protein
MSNSNSIITIAYICQRKCSLKRSSYQAEIGTIETGPIKRVQ